MFSRYLFQNQSHSILQNVEFHKTISALVKTERNTNLSTHNLLHALLTNFKPTKLFLSIFIIWIVIHDIIMYTVINPDHRDWPWLGHYNNVFILGQPCCRGFSEEVRLRLVCLETQTKVLVSPLGLKTFQICNIIDMHISSASLYSPFLALVSMQYQ